MEGGRRRKTALYFHWMNFFLEPLTSGRNSELLCPFVCQCLLSFLDKFLFFNFNNKTHASEIIYILYLMPIICRCLFTKNLKGLNEKYLFINNLDIVYIYLN